jgi:hypothetical protein
MRKLFVIIFMLFFATTGILLAEENTNAAQTRFGSITVQIIGLKFHSTIQKEGFPANTSRPMLRLLKKSPAIRTAFSLNIFLMAPTLSV